MNYEQILEYLKEKKFQKRLNSLSKKYKGKKILIYGAGSFFKAIKENYDLSWLDIVGITDKKYNKGDLTEEYGYKAYSPQNMMEAKPETILIAMFSPHLAIEFFNSELIPTHRKIKYEPLVKRSLLLEKIKKIIAGFNVKFKIMRKARMPVQAVNILAEDIPLVSNEIHSPNNFYGHASALKKYAGYSPAYKIKASIEHGIYLSNKSWSGDIKAKLPAIFVFSKNEQKVLNIKKNTNKAIFGLGPLIHYAEDILSAKKLDSEKKRLGQNLLVFPAHSTHHIDSHYDIHHFCKTIKKMGKDFDSIRICLYWKDILRGNDKIFKEYGFECVTAGHIYDPNFLPRLKSIINTSTITASNQVGTHLGYSIFMGKSHYLIDQFVEFDCISDNIDPEAYNMNKRFLEIFGVLSDKITKEQYDFVNQYWGFDDIKSKEQIRKIFEITENLYRQQEMETAKESLITKCSNT